jgi:hypothetical protein
MFVVITADSANAASIDGVNATCTIPREVSVAGKRRTSVGAEQNQQKPHAASCLYESASNMRSNAGTCGRLFLIGVLLLGAALPAMAQEGPRPGDSCSTWVVCPGGAASSGNYPNCNCDGGRPPPSPTCERDYPCPDPGHLSGTWPNCSCDQPPPPPVCGPCEILQGHLCIPIDCRR